MFLWLKEMSELDMISTIRQCFAKFFGKWKHEFITDRSIEPATYG